MKRRTHLDLLTVQEVAAMMRVSALTIRRHIRRGDLAAVRVGRRVRVPREALQRLVKPVQPKTAKAAGSLKGRPFSLSDPLWNIVGIARSEGPADVSENKDKYLSEGYSAAHE